MACPRASWASRGGGLGVSGFRAALERGEIHLQAHEPLLRAVVDVALEPAERDILGVHRGAARGGLGPHLLRERVGAPGAEHPLRHGVMHHASPFSTQGSVTAQIRRR